jgi:hypothetical protein
VDRKVTIVKSDQRDSADADEKDYATGQHQRITPGFQLRSKIAHARRFRHDRCSYCDWPRPAGPVCRNAMRCEHGLPMLDMSMKGINENELLLA